MRYVSAALCAIASALVASACVSAPAPGGADDPVYAAIGQAVSVNGLRVTPLAVLEDSRCPASVTCVWSGQVRLSVRTGQGHSGSTHELTTGKPVDLGPGSLELIDVRPARRTPDPIAPANYRFGLRYMTEP